MIEILTWTSIITGGVLVILLLMSLLGGLDLDVDTGSTDVDSSSGGLGLLKGLLTFVSVSSWVMKILMVGQKGTTLSLFVAVLSGIVALLLLNYLLKALLRNQENVNWEMNDALYQNGTTYLRIPPNGEGIVNVEIKGGRRELKAKAKNQEEIKTGEPIMVVDIVDEYAIVEVAK